jgi:hypothetical protein
MAGASVSYMAACPGCGRDAIHTSVGEGWNSRDSARLSHIEVDCDCDDRTVLNPGKLLRRLVLRA